MVELSGFVMLTGVAVAILGVRRGIVAMRAPAGNRQRLLPLAQGFRIAVVGMTVLGVGTWMATGELWILMVSLGIGGEELLESSFIIAMLKHSERTRPRRDCQPKSHRSLEVPGAGRPGSANVGC